MDGAWMNFAWGHMEHVRMALKHSSQTLHVLMGSMFQVFCCSNIKTCVKLPTKTWHVSVSGRFWVSSFMWHVSRHYISKGWNQCWIVVKTWHVLTLICLVSCIARASKLTSNHFKMSNTFMTCWNNVEAMIP
jgi:hypothetical protein